MQVASSSLTSLQNLLKVKSNERRTSSSARFVGIEMRFVISSRYTYVCVSTEQIDMVRSSSLTMMLCCVESFQ